VPEATVFALGWGKAHREITVGKVHEHAKIPLLDGFGDCLDVLHFEGTLGLKLVQRTVVGAEPKPSVLFGDREHGGFKVPKGFALRPAGDLRA
jgi:hypothetical protein